MVFLITKTSLGIIGLFRSEYKANFHVREMAKLLSLSHVGLLPHLKLLEEGHILKSRISGRNRSYSLDFSNSRAKEFLAMSEKAALLNSLESNLFIRKLYDELFMARLDCCFALFGSFASGNQTESSDIDLLAIGAIPDSEKKSLKSFGRLYKRDIHLTTLSLEEFRTALQKNNALINEVVKSHVLLHNSEAFLNELWREHVKGN
ncbi:MAG: nucleotidyltransferase domain-containing protein [archaeon]